MLPSAVKATIKATIRATIKIGSEPGCEPSDKREEISMISNRNREAKVFADCVK